MSEQILHYKAKIHVSFISGNTEYKFLEESIKSVVLDCDYDNYNMPVIYLNLSLKSDMYNKMVTEMDSSKIYLNIQKYNVLEQNGAYIDDIKDQFKYMMPSDLNYNTSLGTESEENSDTESEAYVNATVGLIKDSIIADNKQTFGGIYYGINKSTLAYSALMKMEKVCMEPFPENETFDCLIIPAISTVTDFLKWIDGNVKKLYKTGYRYFHDLDITYLLSESGEGLKNGVASYGSIVINSCDTVLDQSKSLGVACDPSTKSYIIYVDANASGMDLDKTSAESVDTAVMVDENGNTKKVSVNQQGVSNDNPELVPMAKSTGSSYETTAINADGSSIEDNSKDEPTNDDERKEFVRTGQTDKKYMKGDYKSNLQVSSNANGALVQFSRLQLDDSIITPNKEYLLTNYDGSASNYNGSYDGGYILSAKRTTYTLEDGEFIPTVNISLRKISAS